MNAELRDGIAHLLHDTGHAHHKAFEVMDGADVELHDIHHDSQHPLRLAFSFLLISANY